MKKDTLQHLIPWVIAADFPLLYIGTITLEIYILTIAAVSIMVIASFIATLVY